MNEQQKFYQKMGKFTFPEDAKVTIDIYDSQADCYKPGKRYEQSKYQIFDEINVAMNEVVWDLDWKSYKANYIRAKAIIEALENRNMPYYLTVTGGKGVHIHTFFNKLIFTNEKSKELFKESVSYGFDFKHIRLWVWNTILDEAGIEIDDRGKGKPVDSAPLIFNYMAGSTHLIRALGGKKWYKNNEGEWVSNYKTYVTKAEFNSKKIVVTNFDQVKYPDYIPTFNIDEAEFSKYLQDYVNNQQKVGSEKLLNYTADCKYVNLDGVLKIRDGMPEGRRSAGASVIAIACRIDNLEKEEAYKIIGEYVENCSQMGTKFTLKEGKQWIDWIYTHDSVYWNCQLLKDLDSHTQATCEHCKARYKDAYKLLTQTTILQQIKEVLDYEIVGEDDTKMLIFLLSLSKDFPSKTGQPGWNLPQDPMSQNVILASDSSSGKSWVIKKILDLFGEDGTDYFSISRLSKNAINYYTDLNMDGKIIFIEELQGLDENTSQLRVWMSEGKLSLQTVEKVINDEGMEANGLVAKDTKGQPVFITNQAEGQVEDQLNNRSWIISMDVTASQTAKILDYQDKLMKGEVVVDMVKKRAIRDALKQLKAYHFIIPFANRVEMGIPIDDIRARRDYQKFLTLVQCSAYLHQKQREIVAINNNEFIVCDVKDYDIARHYSSNILGATFSGLTTNQIDLINYVKNSSWKQEFMISDIMRNLGKSQSHWHGELTQLENLGFVTADKSPGKSSVYSLVDSKAISIISLPSGEELIRRLKVNSTYISYAKSKTEQEEVEKQRLIGIIGAINEDTPLNEGITHYNEFQENESHLLDLSKVTIEEKAIIEGKKIDSSVETPKLIGAISRISLQEYMKKTNKHEIPFEDFFNKFNPSTEDELYKILNQMKNEGDIFESKPGRYMLL